MKKTVEKSVATAAAPKQKNEEEEESGIFDRISRACKRGWDRLTGSAREEEAAPEPKKPRLTRGEVYKRQMLPKIHCYLSLGHIANHGKVMRDEINQILNEGCSVREASARMNKLNEKEGAVVENLAKREETLMDQAAEVVNVEEETTALLPKKKKARLTKGEKPAKKKKEDDAKSTKSNKKKKKANKH